MGKYKDKSFIAISAIWYERFLECSRTYGTEYFVGSVWKFYHSLLNIGDDELAIKDVVRKYHNEVWKPKLQEVSNLECEQNNISINDSGSRDVIYQQNEKEMIVDLFEYIIQTIQDSGVGFQIIPKGDAESSDYDEAMQEI